MCWTPLQREGLSPCIALVSAWPFDYVIMMRKRRLLSASFFLVSEQTRKPGPFSSRLSGFSARGIMPWLAAVICSIPFVRRAAAGSQWHPLRSDGYVLTAFLTYRYRRAFDQTEILLFELEIGPLAVVQSRTIEVVPGCYSSRTPLHMAFRGWVIAEEFFEPNCGNIAVSLWICCLYG